MIPVNERMILAAISVAERQGCTIPTLVMRIALEAALKHAEEPPRRTPPPRQLSVG